jgi:hypothetical protein
MKKIIFSLCCCLLPSLSAGQDLFTVDDVRIMHDAGVKVQFNEKTPPHVLPADISPRDLLRVEMLDLSDSSLYRIPPWLKRFTNLRRLDLSNNHLDADSDLLEALQAMPKLDVLNLSDNPLFAKEPTASKSLAPTWQRLSELGELYLSETGGTAKNFGSLAPLWSLKILDISRNRISNKIGMLELNKLTGLQELNLSHNDISQFPETELPIQNLEKLDLSHNDLTEIPYVAMDALKIWDLQGNWSVRLADDYGDIFSLKNIKELRYNSGVDHDNLSKLPEGLRKKLEGIAEREKERLYRQACSEGIKLNQYLDHCNGTITDKKTGLMWKRCSEGQAGVNCEEGAAKKYTWDDAVQRFKHVEYAGYTDWRLPTIDELKTLVYCSNGNPANAAWEQGCNKDFSISGFERPTINQPAFPKTQPYSYWSGSQHDSETNSAWLVNFSFGTTNSISPFNFLASSYAVRLVRNGQ